jgi:D-Tyr-tRNAtyr deacylase
LRPGFSRAAEPAKAASLFATFVELLRRQHQPVATGIFAADMQVNLVNDGPVTFLLEL